jgi:hypothetical protein
MILINIIMGYSKVSCPGPDIRKISHSRYYRDTRGRPEGNTKSFKRFVISTRLRLKQLTVLAVWAHHL